MRKEKSRGEKLQKNNQWKAFYFIEKINKKTRRRIRKNVNWSHFH